MYRALALVLMAGCSWSPPPFEPLPVRPAEAEAQEWIESYAAWLWGAFPVDASEAGIHDYDHTFGGQAWSDRASRIETLRYYLEEFGRVTPDLAGDLAAARMDAELRLAALERMQRVSALELGLIPRGVMALLNQPPDRQQALKLAMRIQEIGPLMAAQERLCRTEPERVRAALAAALEWFKGCDPRERDLGHAAAGSVLRELDRLAIRPTNPDELRLGEKRTEDMVSLWLYGELGRSLPWDQLTKAARRWLANFEGAAPGPSVNGAPVDPALIVAEIHAAAREVLPIPEGILRVIEPAAAPPVALIPPGAFENGEAWALFAARPAEPAALKLLVSREIYPGRLTQALYLKAVTSKARRLARNPAILEGFPHYMEREMARRLNDPALAAAERRSHRLALCRLAAVVAFHAGRSPLEEVSRLFQVEAGLSKAEADLEAEEAAWRPEAMAAALGARWLHGLRAESGAPDVLPRVLSIGSAPLESVSRRIVESSSVGLLFSGKAAADY